jgi:hypothetical protein
MYLCFCVPKLAEYKDREIEDDIVVLKLKFEKAR